MRKIIYRPDHITEDETVVILDEDDIIPKKEEKEVPEVFVLDGDDPSLKFDKAEFEEFDEQDEDEELEETEPRAKKSKKPTELDLEQFREMGRMIIEQATAEASRIIEEGHQRAQAEYVAVMQQAQTRIEDDRETARRQGRAEALKSHSQQIENCIKDIGDAICRLESTQAAFITGYENDLKWLAVEIAQKILGDTIRADQTSLSSLVMKAVISAKKEGKLSVEISDKMLDLLSVLQQKLKEAGLEDSVSVKLSSIPEDSCIVETPDRFIDASIPRQIENLKQYFQSEGR